MGQYRVRLVKPQRTRDSTQEEQMDKRLKASEERESEYHLTLLMPDHALPEKERSARSFGDESANVAIVNSKTEGLPLLNMSEAVRGPWNEETKMSEAVFAVEGRKEYGVLIVQRITEVYPRKLTAQHIMAMKTLLKKDQTLPAMDWVEGRAPPRNIPVEVCVNLDSAIERARKPRIRKYDSNKKKKEVSAAIVDEALTLYYGAKFEMARPLFFGDRAIYHWSNICDFVKSASLACIHFLVEQAKTAGPAMGFARSLLANAQMEGCKYARFSFPLVRKEVYERLLTPEIMEAYGEKNKAVWLSAYSLFHEVITRAYMETHSLAPWDKGPETGADLMTKSTPRLPLTNATCLAVKDIDAMGIPYNKAALALLVKLKCVQIPLSTQPDSLNQGYVYVDTMRKYEMRFAEGIRILNERCMKGYMPAILPSAAEAFRRAWMARFNDEPNAPNDLQLEAVKSVIVNAVTVITGAGGCGKTWVTDFLIDHIFYEPQIIIAAPTCAATSRLAGNRCLANMTARTVQYYQRVCNMWKAQTSGKEKDANLVVEGEPLTKTFSGSGSTPVTMSFIPPRRIVKLATATETELIESDLVTDDDFKHEFALHFPFVANHGLHPKGWARGEYPEERTGEEEDDDRRWGKGEARKRGRNSEKEEAAEPDDDEDRPKTDDSIKVLFENLPDFKKKKEEFFLRHRTIVYLDETAQCSLPALSFVWDLVENGYVSRLVLIGDWRQNGPIGPGKILRTIIEKKLKGINVIELTHNYRAAAENRSLVKNAMAIAEGKWDKFIVDKYSRILFRVSKSLLWLVAQMVDASRSINDMIAITHRKPNSEVLNSAFYVMFVWLKAEKPRPASFETWAHVLRQLLWYLVENPAVNPFIVGCAEVAEKASSLTPSAELKDEVDRLRKVKLHYTPGMRISYSKNINVAKISSNKQLIIVKFMDVDAAFVDNYLQEENPSFIYMSGNGKCKLGHYEVKMPLGKTLLAPEQKVDYTASCFHRDTLFNAYKSYELSPRNNPRALIRCMVYYNHSPHNRSNEKVLYWCPIQLPSLAMVPSNVRPRYATSGHSFQGCEEVAVFKVADLPESILPDTKPDFWAFREQEYTIASRPKEQFTMAVAGKYANNMNPKPVSSQSCVVDKMPNPVSVGENSFFGHEQVVRRISPLPPSLLPQTVDSELQPIIREIEDKNAKCRCKHQHQFVQQLLDIICKPSHAQVDSDDEDGDGNADAPANKKARTGENVINEGVCIPFITLEQPPPLDEVEAMFD